MQPEDITFGIVRFPFIPETIMLLMLILHFNIAPSYRICKLPNYFLTHYVPSLAYICQTGSLLHH